MLQVSILSVTNIRYGYIQVSLTCYGIVCVTSVPDIYPRQISGMVTCESLLVIVLSVLQVYLIWLQVCISCYGIVCVASVPDLVTGVSYMS